MNAHVRNQPQANEDAGICHHSIDMPLSGEDHVYRVRKRKLDKYLRTHVSPFGVIPCTGQDYLLGI